MGERDKNLLGAAGLSYSRASGFLQVTRQTLHERVNSHGEYLDEKRLAKIYLALHGSDKAEDKEKARSLAEAARHAYKLDLEKSSIALDSQSVWDYYIVFSSQPMELTDSAYAGFMAAHIFPKARLVAYFVGTDSSSHAKLLKVIKHKRKVRERPSWEAEIFVIKTPLVDVLPHIALLRDRSGEWEGQVFDLLDSRSSTLAGDYVCKLVWMLTFNGFALEPEHAPNQFFSNGSSQEDELETKGFEFDIIEHLPKEAD